MAQIDYNIILKEYGIIGLITIILMSTFIFIIKILLTHTLKQSEKLMQIITNHFSHLTKALEKIIIILEQHSEEHKEIIKKIQK